MSISFPLLPYREKLQMFQLLNTGSLNLNNNEASIDYIFRSFSFFSPCFFLFLLGGLNQLGLFSPVFIIGGLIGRVFGEMAHWADKYIDNVNINFKVQSKLYV